MEITSGVLKRPQKVVVYGPEGIGKSTFASHFPDPLFLDIEDSTSQLDVKRIQGINSWEMLLSLISQINRERPCKTVVVDTADWAEKLCIQHVCAVNKISAVMSILRAHAKANGGCDFLFHFMFLRGIIFAKNGLFGQKTKKAPSTQKNPRE